MLLSEEYIEQAFFFESFIESLEDGITTQEFLHSIRGELLTTAQLYKAVDFMLTDVKYTGVLAISMRLLNHYFSPFQTFIISESEREDGHLDFKIALQILAREAKYRSNNPTTQGVFFYQFETLCRNRLGYVRGLDMLIKDDFYNADWKEWLTILRRQIGFVPLADMIFYRSEYYKIYLSRISSRQFNRTKKIDLSKLNLDKVHEISNANNSDNYQSHNSNSNSNKEHLNNSYNNNYYVAANNCNENTPENNDELDLFDLSNDDTDVVVLFGEREGRIAFATRNKEPAYLFAALSRHLGYPSVPRKKNVTEDENIIPLLKRRIEQLENRIQLLEEEQRGGIDLNRYIKSSS